jgi:hypothetical protein
MGQQQLLLIVLGVIVVGIAIAVGISQFGASSTESNKDAITSSLVNLAANAYQFKIRPSTLGGGSNAYNGGGGYTIPAKMLVDDNGSYAVSGTPTASQVLLTGTSKMNSAWVATCTVDDTGKTTIAYGGW